MGLSHGCEVHYWRNAIQPRCISPISGTQATNAQISGSQDLMRPMEVFGGRDRKGKYIALSAIQHSVRRLPYRCDRQIRCREK